MQGGTTKNRDSSLFCQLYQNRTSKFLTINCAAQPTYLYAQCDVRSSPNGSQPAQLLEGLAHSPLELQSGCSVLYVHIHSWYIHTKNCTNCHIVGVYLAIS